MNLSTSGNLPNPTGHIITTIERRGRLYMINNPGSSEDDDIVNRGNISTMIDDLYQESLDMSRRANRIASVHKIVYSLCKFLIIVSGMAVGILSIQQTNYIVAVIGFAVTAVQSILDTFAVERRGVLLKDTANRLRTVSRKCRAIQNSDLDEKTKLHKVEELYAEVDEQDMNIFDNNITSAKPPKSTNSKGHRSDSDLNSKDDPLAVNKVRRSDSDGSFNKGPILPMTTADVKV